MCSIRCITYIVKRTKETAEGKKEAPRNCSGTDPSADDKKGGNYYVQTYSFYKRQFLEKPFLRF